ncbi:MAG: DUF5661 family protein [Phenylobacterium sp.]
MKSIHSKKWKDKLKGGLADDCVPSDFNSDQLSKGIKVEMEHTDDPEIAKEIAMDHLQEANDKINQKGGKYYDKLKDMEEDIEKEKKEINKSYGDRQVRKKAQTFNQDDYMDLIGFYTESGELVSAKRYNQQYVNRAETDNNIIVLEDVPVGLAQRLLLQGTGRQWFEDGFDAALAANPYRAEDDLDYADENEDVDGMDNIDDDDDEGILDFDASFDDGVYADDDDENEASYMDEDIYVAKSFFELTKFAQFDDDYPEPYEDDLMEFRERELDADAAAGEFSDYDDEDFEDETYLTIEPDIEGGGYNVVRHDTYERGSVLEGLPRDSIIDDAETLDELTAKYPDAEILDNRSARRLSQDTIANLPPPDDFDPMDAGEEW